MRNGYLYDIKWIPAQRSIERNAKWRIATLAALLLLFFSTAVYGLQGQDHTSARRRPILTDDHYTLYKLYTLASTLCCSEYNCLASLSKNLATSIFAFLGSTKHRTSQPSNPIANKNQKAMFVLPPAASMIADEMNGPENPDVFPTVLSKAKKRYIFG